MCRRFVSEFLISLSAPSVRLILIHQKQMCKMILSLRFSTKSFLITQAMWLSLSEVSGGFVCVFV